MKKLFWALIAFGLFTFTGCQDNSPEDVAITYIDAISNADTAKAESVSTSNAKERLDLLKEYCNETAAESLARESFNTLKMLYKYDNPFDAPDRREKARKILDNLRKNLSSEGNKVFEEVVKKYGDPKSLPIEKRKELLKEVLDKFSDSIGKNTVLKLMDLYKIKTKSPNDVAKVIAMYLIKNDGRMRLNRRSEYIISDIAKEVYASKNIAPSKECISSSGLSYMVGLKKITPIETKQISVDKAEVRLELVSGEGKSTKVIMNVEKMQDHWKVTGFERD